MIVWLLVRASIPFLPAGHPWKGQRFTLAEWLRGQTALARQFNLVFTGCFIALAVVLSTFFLKF